MSKVKLMCIPSFMAGEQSKDLGWDAIEHFLNISNIDHVTNEEQDATGVYDGIGTETQIAWSSGMVKIIRRNK